jgi:hypothetical protein
LAYLKARHLKMRKIHALQQYNDPVD